MDHPHTPPSQPAYNAICGLLARLAPLRGFAAPAQAIFDRRVGELVAHTGLRPDQLSLAEVASITEATAREYAEHLAKTLKFSP